MTRIGKASVRLSKAFFVPNWISRIPIYEMPNASEATKPGDLSLSVAGSAASVEVCDVDRSTENWRNSKIQELQLLGLTVCPFRVWCIFCSWDSITFNSHFPRQFLWPALSGLRLPGPTKPQDPGAQKHPGKPASCLLLL